MALVIRHWAALPSVFNDLAEGKPVAEVLLDPEPLAEGLEMYDEPVRFAVRDGEAVYAYGSLDGYAELVPPGLVDSIPAEAFSAYDAATKKGPSFFSD